MGREGATGRIDRAERSSRNGTCPKVGLHAAVALQSAPGKLIYKSRGAPRGARLLRRKTEQKGFCSAEYRCKAMVLMGESHVSFRGCKPFHLFL